MYVYIYIDHTWYIDGNMDAFFQQSLSETVFGLASALGILLDGFPWLNRALQTG